ncbi:hypothetical protein ABIE67_000542 [Streptomyces sp. V4I8]
MAGRHRKACTELTSIRARALRGSIVAAPLSAGLLASATSASADVNPFPFRSVTHAPPLKGTGPGTGRPPVITWDYIASLDAPTRGIIFQGIQSWDQALRKASGRNASWFARSGSGVSPALIFNMARLGPHPNGGMKAGEAGDNCIYVRVQCGNGQRVTLNSDWWYRWRPSSEQKLGVVTHEIGHTLGLGHSTGGNNRRVPGNSDEIMRWEIPSRSVPTEPSADEAATVTRLYGQSRQQATNQGTGVNPHRPQKVDPRVQQPRPRSGTQHEWHGQQGGWQGNWRMDSNGQWQGGWTPTQKVQRPQPEQGGQNGLQQAGPRVQQPRPQSGTQHEWHGQQGGWQGNWRMDSNGQWQGGWTPTQRGDRSAAAQDGQGGPVPAAAAPGAVVGGLGAAAVQPEAKNAGAWGQEAPPPSWGATAPGSSGPASAGTGTDRDGSPSAGMGTGYQTAQAQALQAQLPQGQLAQPVQSGRSGGDGIWN